MTNEYDAETAKKIIYEDNNINVTEANPLKDFVQIVLKLLLIIFAIYFFVFIVSGIIINTLPIKKQIALENFMSKLNFGVRIVPISEMHQKRIDRIKNNILLADKKFPKTSNLQVYIMENKRMNAFCYPNGNIYITKPLYDKLDTDEKLTFILAHEMAHYKHKDHLQVIQRGISSSSVILLFAIANQNNSQITNIIEKSIDVTDLKFSRGREKKADKYAVKILNALYGNTKGGVEVMEILKKESLPDLEILSTHPDIDKRMKYIRKMSN